MKEIEKEQLKQIKGGITLSSAIVNRINNLIKILMDAGNKVGSALRRIGSNQICPLE